MLGYGTDDCPPVDVITGPGNVYVAAAKRLLRGRVAHRRRGWPDRDRDRRRRRRGRQLHRRRPGRPGRARPAGGLPADHHQRRAGRPGRHRAGQGSGAGQARRAGPGRADRAVGLRDRRRRRRRAGGLRRLGARAPGDPGGGRGDPGPPGSQRRRHLRRRLGAGLARRLPGRLQPRAADRRHGPLHRRAVGAVVPARCAHRGVRRRPRCASVAPYIDALGGAEDLAAHVQAVRVRVPAEPGQP